jgi:hypothetical protein
MWTSDAMLYKALGIAPWPGSGAPKSWRPDVLYKGLYAVATSAAYDRLS